QQGILEFKPQQIDLALLVARNVALFTPIAAEKEIEVNHDGPPYLKLRADLKMLDAIIRNLLSNALKFTKPGGTVDIHTGNTGPDVTLTVHDTGIGIPAEKLNDLFVIHAKYKRPGTGGEPGTGLGLILCHEFVKYHGGTIGVESQNGGGTTFYCTFPAPEK
ncbi:hypothetical protein GF348_16995, partial [candidate division KSB3 bacterium]|nr:hypothetical protein [candidate division KSB3 bacterium]